jgi:NTP pyrophosphatase (non-canonical NTP hydrolase)
MTLEEILNELLDIANEHGGDLETNIDNVVSSPNEEGSKKEISVIIKIKP